MSQTPGSLGKQRHIGVEALKHIVPGLTSACLDAWASPQKTTLWYLPFFNSLEPFETSFPIAAISTGIPPFLIICHCPPFCHCK